MNFFSWPRLSTNSGKTTVFIWTCKCSGLSLLVHFIDPITSGNTTLCFQHCRCENVGGKGSREHLNWTSERVSVCPFAVSMCWHQLSRFFKLPISLGTVVLMWWLQADLFFLIQIYSDRNCWPAVLTFSHSILQIQNTAILHTAATVWYSAAKQWSGFCTYLR